MKAGLVMPAPIHILEDFKLKNSDWPAKVLTFNGDAVIKYRNSLKQAKLTCEMLLDQLAPVQEKKNEDGSEISSGIQANTLESDKARCF
jgi:hypothetical protein